MKQLELIDYFLLLVSAIYNSTVPTKSYTLFVTRGIFYLKLHKRAIS